MTDFDVNSSESTLPSLPSLDGVTDPAVKKFLQAVKESIEIRAGQRPNASIMDRGLTFRDLYKYNLASFKINGEEVTNPDPDNTVNTPGQTGGNSSGGSSDGDLTLPGSPVGFVATGTALSVLLEWDDPETNIGYAEVWRAEVNNQSLAVKVGTTEASVYADIINEAGRTFFYWIRFVNRGGIPGNFNDDMGTSATTGQIGSDELISVDGAKIIDATILNAKIVNISADKITTGILNATESISVGSSTERIHITGSGRIRSGGAVDFMNGSGFYFDNPLGLGRAFIGNGTHYVAWNGSQLTIEANNFSLTPNSFSFNGSGHFTGSLNVNNNFVVDPNGNATMVNATVSGHVDSLTGTFGGQLLAGVLDFSQLDGVRSTYLTPGVYTLTVPVGKTTMRATLCGASGGGGGAGNVNGSGGGGGGSTGVYIATFTGLTPGATYTLTVGERGARGLRAPWGGNFLNYGTNGGNGGNTSIAGLLTAVGGGGGGRGGPTASFGGAAGTNGRIGFAGGGPASSPVPPDHGYGGPGASAGNGTTILAGNKGGYGGWAVGTQGDNAENGLDGFAYIEFFNPNSVVLQTTYNQLLTKLQNQGIQVP
jgi:hypothetical protein